jgi:hypothetical protein
MRSAALLAATRALTGCGGGGPLTAEEYRSRANEICAEANADLLALEPPDSLESMRDFVDEANPIAEDATEKLDKLEPPREHAAAHDRWVEENRRVTQLLGELANDDLSGVAREFDHARRRATVTARDDLGLEDCGPQAWLLPGGRRRLDAGRAAGEGGISRRQQRQVGVRLSLAPDAVGAEVTQPEWHARER